MFAREVKVGTFKIGMQAPLPTRNSISDQEGEELSYGGLRT